MQTQQMKLLITWKYVIAFLFLTMLCGTSHEFVHHFSGAAICGCFGYKTFNSFTLCDSCHENPYRLWATVAGPAFTYLLMWIGMYQLKMSGNKNKQLGFALIFANFPINRIFFALIDSNDEQYIARHLFGHSQWAFWITNLIIWLCTVPPLYYAYKSIANKRKLFWFIGFFVLPFVFVLFFGLFLEQYLLLQQKILASTVVGIPLLILLVEIICLAGYFLMKKYIYSPVLKDDNLP